MLDFLAKKKKPLDAARLYFQKGKYDKAEKLCLEELNKNENNEEALKILSEIYRKNRDDKKFRDISLRLADIYLSERNVNSSLVLLRSVLKRQPNDIEVYKKLLDIYKTANMQDQLIDVLFKLGDIYIKNDLSTEATNIFMELLEINKRYKSLDTCFKILDRFQILDNRLMITAAVKEGINIAKEVNNIEGFNRLINIASKHDCDIGENIKLTIDYFKENKDKLDYFIKYLIKYFINISSGLDVNFLKTLIDNFEFNELKGLFNALHKKYKDMELYKVELDCFIDKKDFPGINYALHKIAELTDTPILMEAFEYIVLKSEKIDQPNILFNVGLLAVRLKKHNQARDLFNRALQFIGDSDIELRKEIERNLSDIEKYLKDYDLQYEKMKSAEDIEITDVKKIEDVGLDKPNDANIFDYDNIEVEVVYDEENILSKAEKLIERNLYEDAIKELGKLIQSNKQLYALPMIAECYEKLDNKREAIVYYKRFLEKLDDNHKKEEYLIRIANLYFDIGDRKNTFNTIMELSKLNPSYKF